MRLALLLALLSACGAPRFSYNGDETLALCPAVAEIFREHRRVLFDAWGARDPGGGVQYIRTAAPAECPEGRACAIGTVVRSPSPLDQHELVHAYLAPLGRPPALLYEGMAVAFDCG